MLAKKGFIRQTSLPAGSRNNENMGWYEKAYIHDVRYDISPICL